MPSSGNASGTGPSGRSEEAVTFTLKEGIAYSDGQPIVAGDFVYSWKRLIDPRNAAHAQALANKLTSASPDLVARVKKAIGQGE